MRNIILHFLIYLFLSVLIAFAAVGFSKDCNEQEVIPCFQTMCLCLIGIAICVGFDKE